MTAVSQPERLRSGLRVPLAGKMSAEVAEVSESMLSGISASLSVSKTWMSRRAGDAMARAPASACLPCFSSPSEDVNPSDAAES